MQMSKGSPSKRSEKRSYSSDTRRRQAEETKVSIAAAARKLLSKSGYAGVTVPDIARAAGVAVPTVYAAFGSKKGIIADLLDQARFGDVYHGLVRDAAQVSDPAERLSFAARIARQIYEAEIPIQNLLRGAGMLAPELDALENERESDRYAVQTHLIKYLIQTKALRENLDRVSAGDILWSLTSRDLFRLLVLKRGWAPEKYEQWLIETLRNALL
jgi:AcrR family transcriptional regulator